MKTYIIISALILSSAFVPRLCSAQATAQTNTVLDTIYANDTKNVALSISLGLTKRWRNKPQRRHIKNLLARFQNVYLTLIIRLILKFLKLTPTASSHSITHNGLQVVF